MASIKFESELIKINGWTLLVLPKDASSQLPSRGLANVKGTINGAPFHDALEPDGRKSHWLAVDEKLRRAAGIDVGDTVAVEIETAKQWAEPSIPADIMSALAKNPKVHALWNEITPMARWEWLRWIRATNRSETRSRRIEVAVSKLKSGMRRPCCFNASMCTVPEVSRNGALLEPALTND